MTSCWVLWVLCLGVEADCQRAGAGLARWGSRISRALLGLGRSQQTCWACSAMAGPCPAGGSSCAEWLWLCKAASWLLAEHPALPSSSWTSMFLSGYCSLTVWKDYLNSESKALWIISTPLMFCFLVLDWGREFGCQNMYLRFCKGEEVCVFAVRITALCRLWALYLVLGKAGFSRCWHLWRSSLSVHVTLCNSCIWNLLPFVYRLILVFGALWVLHCSGVQSLKQNQL